MDILRTLGQQLVDVHSQHQTLRLTENDFQLKVLDALADNKERLQEYAKQWSTFKRLNNELRELQDFQDGANKEHDYNSFLLKELHSAQLKSGIQETLESEHEQLSNYGGKKNKHYHCHRLNSMSLLSLLSGTFPVT